MSKRHRHAKPCPTPTKTPFGSQVATDLAIARIRAEDSPNRVTLPCRSYRCPCGKWHMTSRSRSYDEIAAEQAHAN